MKLNRIIPVALVAASVCSGLLGFKDGALITFTLAALCAVWAGCGKLERCANKFRRRRELDRMPVFSLHGKILRMTDKTAGTEERIIDELSRVQIITTDQGPFVCDSFLVLAFQDGKKWLTPLENPSYTTFYKRLGKILPLDSEQAILAAASTEKAVFTLWDREKTA